MNAWLNFIIYQRKSYYSKRNSLWFFFCFQFNLSVMTSLKNGFNSFSDEFFFLLLRILSNNKTIDFRTFVRVAKETLLFWCWEKACLYVIQIAKCNFTPRIFPCPASHFVSLHYTALVYWWQRLFPAFWNTICYFLQPNGNNSMTSRRPVSKAREACLGWHWKMTSEIFNT